MITSTEQNRWYENRQAEEGLKSVSIRIGEAKQTIRGFGGCFNELGAIALETLNEADRKSVNDALFSESGCNFNFCRLSIGANDFAESWYSYDEVEGDYALEHFSIDRDKKHIIPWIREAQSRQPELSFMASPWSPPTWMKYPKAYNFGTLVQTEENLKAYALYFRKYIDSYAAEGIPVAQIHVQNEPASSQKFPSCVWTGEEFRSFIGGYLAPALEGKADIFLGTINGPENDNRALITRFHNYAHLVLQDEACRRAVTGVSYQWAGKFAVQQTHDSYPDLELIQSESECGWGDNSWDYAMYIFEMIRHYFRNGVSAYVYWNMALASGGMSTWGWHQNSLITVENGHFLFNPEYYVMKHFSHFVKPGARYLDTFGEWAANTAAFRNPDGETVLVIMNPLDKKTNVTVEGTVYTLEPRSFNTISGI